MQIGKGSGDNACSATTWSLGSNRTCPFRAPTGRLLTTRCATSSSNSIQRLSAFISAFRKKNWFNEFEIQVRRSFPQRPQSMKPAGWKTEVVTLSSPKATKLVGTEEFFSARLFGRRPGETQF